MLAGVEETATHDGQEDCNQEDVGSPVAWLFVIAVGVVGLDSTDKNNSDQSWSGDVRDIANAQITGVSTQ